MMSSPTVVDVNVVSTLEGVVAVAPVVVDSAVAVVGVNNQKRRMPHVVEDNSVRVGQCFGPIPDVCSEFLGNLVA